MYRTLIEPALRPGTSVTHVVCRGLDGWRSVLSIEDALADDVLIADRLDGRPLSGDHGAPARLVSPRQYGYVSTKHLCRIEVHTAEPKRVHKSVLRLLGPHPRARVWEEERHRYLPAWLLRRPYRATIAFVITWGRRRDVSQPAAATMTGPRRQQEPQPGRASLRDQGRATATAAQCASLDVVEQVRQGQSVRSRTDGMWWGTAIEAPDPGDLARFYSQLLGWPIGHEEPGTAILAAPQGSIYVVFQQATDYQPPVWPPVAGEQRPMMHFDFQVGDLDSAVAEALALGATVAKDQPQENVRVLFDPAGHPFCLCLDED
ncbi:MAG: VOC family protein [Geodermatophilaceae bacterium]